MKLARQRNTDQSSNMKKYIMPLIFLTGIATLVTRAVLDSRFANGTLLYLIIPFVLSAALFFLTKPLTSQSIGAAFVNHLRLVMIIFLITSAFLMEGFLCVLMFMPIYLFMAGISFAFAAIFSGSKSKNSLKSYLLPAIVFGLATEGMLPQTTYPRHNTATYITVTDQSIADLKANMADDIAMPKKRGWFLRLFPLPDKIFAGTLAAGDTHNLHFTYKKWGFGNFHTGEMDILIAKVDDTHIQTQITKNTAYLSHYMNIEGTDVHFTALDNGKTQVSLTVKYERLLDPVWYFGPMQQLAAEQSAKYLVDTIIVKETL